MGYVDPIKIRTIIPRELPQGFKFYIIGDMIKLLNFKCVFAGLLIDDDKIHIMIFLGFSPHITYLGYAKKL